VEIQLPSGYWLAWGGQFENLEAARQRLIVVAPACFFLIFLLLCSALGSARDAVLVFSAVGRGRQILSTNRTSRRKAWARPPMAMPPDIIPSPSRAHGRRPDRFGFMTL